MSEPCVMKDSIDKLFSYHDQKVVKLHDIEMRQIEIQGAVMETKKKIENGMTTKIDKTHDVVTRLEPVIAHHATVINNIETMGWWLSRGVLIALLGMLFWAIKNGYDIKF